MGRAVLASLGVTAGVALVACAPSAGEEGSRSLGSPSAALVAAPIAPARAVERAAVGSLEQEGKRGGGVLVGEVDRQRDYDGPSVSATELPASLASATGRSPVPVLLPGGAAALAAAFVATGEHWYTAQSELDGVWITLFGSRAALDYPELRVDPAQRVSEDNPLVTVSEGVPSVAFGRFGVAYRLDVECAHGPRDARCADAAYLHSVFESLVVVEETR